MKKTATLYTIFLGLFCLLLPGCREEEQGPAPILTGVAPLSGPPGTQVVISGSNFNTTSTVEFSQAKGIVVDRTPNTLLVKVPEGAATGEVKVNSNGQTAVFPHEFTVSLEPSPTLHTITIHENDRVASILLTQAEFASLNASLANGQWYPELFQDVYRKFRDDFDFIIPVYNNTTVPSNLPAGWAHTVSMNIDGIGRGEAFNNSYAWGSEGKLKGVMTITSLSSFVNNLLLHEIMHYWANYKIPAETEAHWGFSGCGGVLGGFDQSSLLMNVDGNPDKYSFREPSSHTFSNFERYLMGLIGPEEIEPFDVLTDVSDVSWPEGRVTFVAKTRNRYDRERIEREFGIRSPDHTRSQKSFKALILVFTPIPLTPEQWTRIDETARKFSLNSDDGEVDWNFWEATLGKAQIEVGNLSKSMKE